MFWYGTISAMRIAVLFLAAGLAAAAPVTISGTVTAGGITIAGDCDYIASQAFTASDGFTVSGSIPVKVSWPKSGALVMSIEPNDTGQPSNTYYTANCRAPAQSGTGADGKTHSVPASSWVWTWIVLSTSSTLQDVLRFKPPVNSLQYYEASITGASTTITAATHRLGTKPWIAGCWDSDGNPFEVTAVIASNGDITITLTYTEALTCKLTGAGSSANWTYTAAMSGRTVTILATAHNLIRPRLGRCYDSSGNDYEPGGFDVNPANDTVTIMASTESPAFSGSCILQ